MNINNDFQDIEPIVDDVIDNEENLNGSLNKIEISDQFNLTIENDEANKSDEKNLISLSSPHPRPPSTSPIPHETISQHNETTPPPPPTPPLLNQEEMPPPPPPPASINGQSNSKPKSQLKRSYSAKPLLTSSNYRPFSSRLEHSNSNNNNYFMNQDSISHAGINNTPLFITHVTLNLDVPGKNLNKPSIPSWKYNTVKKNCANFSYAALMNKNANLTRKGSLMNRPQTSNFLNSNESKNFFLTTSNFISDITNINNNNPNNNNNINNSNNNHNHNVNNNSNNTSSPSNSDSGKNSMSNPDSPPSFRPKSAFTKQKTNRITASISSNEQNNDSDSFKEVDADSVRDSQSNSPRQLNDQEHEQDQDQLDLDLQEKENFYSLNRQDPTRSLSSPVQQLQLITDQYNPTKAMPTYTMPILNNRSSVASLQRAASSTSTQAATRFKAAYDQKLQKLRSKSPYSPSKSSVQPMDSYRAKSTMGYGGESSSSSMESHRSTGRHTYTTAEFNKFKNKLLRNHPRMGYFSSFASNNNTNSIIDASNDKLLNAGLIVNSAKKTLQQQPQLSTSQIKSIYETVQHQTLVSNINLNNTQQNKTKSSVELKRSNYLNRLRQTENFLSSSLTIKKLQ